jgi:hypothetical protein
MKRKKKISELFPCECGHSKRMHGWAGPTIGDEWCNGKPKISKNKYVSYSMCDCDQYRPDNLKYLEQMSKKKGKVK